MIGAGLSVVGSNRIVATGLIFIAWAVFAGLLLALNREPPSEVGLTKPTSVSRTIFYGMLIAASVFVAVVGLEQLGYGTNRLGDLAAELKGNPVLLAERVAISVLVVGPVEEFVFRGFLFLRLTKLFGGSTVAILTALILQAALFGLSHAYQHLYGILLTTSLGIFFGFVYNDAAPKPVGDHYWSRRLRCCARVVPFRIVQEVNPQIEQPFASLDLIVLARVTPKVGDQRRLVTRASPAAPRIKQRSPEHDRNLLPPLSKPVPVRRDDRVRVSTARSH